MAKTAKKTKKVKKINLLIVESPAKAKTIQKYLGNGFGVTASIGHLFDLPRSRLAIDVDKNFEPEYITIRGKAKILKEILKEAKKAEQILLASDNDREGEAIAFHLRNAILRKFPDMKIMRIVFNEITPVAIREAVKSPMSIDINKVNAQKARRILDRLVGYKLSPILWKKVKNGLSAGRVQSVALKLICDRDREVEAFMPQEYWTIDVTLKQGKKTLTSQLVQFQGQKPDIKTKEEVQKLIKLFKGKTFKVADIKQKDKQLKPLAPFTTSKLQQASATRLGYTSRKTMRIAQTLYEGVNIGSERIGLITYMRTDSTRIADTALDAVRKFIGDTYPDELPEQPNIYTPMKKAQDAHEAIRPTYVERTPESVKSYLTGEQFKLYSLIWERFVSSQMKPYKSRILSIEFTCGDGLFRSSTTKVLEKGFYKALKLLAPKEKFHTLPSLEIGDDLECVDLTGDQHFTQGPSYFTDASIIKALEERGIGRPSTYAPIISVLIDRYYVVRKTKRLKATVLGRIISEMLEKTFPEIIDVNFTANVEKRLDEVESKNEPWEIMIGEFYKPFSEKVDYVMEHLESIKGVLEEPTDHICEKCNRPMIKKLGRYGFFIACSGFPECMNSKAVPLADCPKPGCTGSIIAKRKQNKKGKVFYGCTNYPECDFVTYFPPTNTKCPHCGYFLVERSDKKRGDYKMCVNPECDYMHLQEAEVSSGS
ncbi:MAG: type I DNA topoisomerase [Spirochaetales bacterium]|nr:type I DNA topoisomerase [Spirochaetales bacterium]